MKDEKTATHADGQAENVEQTVTFSFENIS
jgi:hypothetical protein